MLLPGAYMSRHDPQLENDDCVSAFVVAPTVIAGPALAGEYPQASASEFPAATT
jgi:hypothetical protein